jgi:hypothetical protein
MNREAYLAAKRKNNIFSDDEARNAIEFALELLEAEQLHIEKTEPSAHTSIARLDAAHSELSSLAGDLEEFMD